MKFIFFCTFREEGSNYCEMKHTRNVFIYTYLFIGFIKFSFHKEVPSIVHRCKYSMDKVALGECIKNEYLRLNENFLNGIPELHLAKFEPYYLEKLQFSIGGGNNAMNFNTLFTNITIHGATYLVLEYITFDLENVEMTAETHFPLAQMFADYQVTGNILVLPLDSTGKGVLNFTELHTKDKYTGQRYTKNGKEYIKFDNGHIDVTIKGLEFYFDNLINGNPELTKSTNKVLNENNQTLLQELKPVAAETFVSIRLNILNIIFTRYSLDELFV